MGGGGFLAHAAQLSGLVLILFGPLPLVVALDARTRALCASCAERLLGIAVGWTVVEIATAVTLGLLGALSLVPVLIASALLLALGLLLRYRSRAARGSASTPLDVAERLVVLGILLLGTTLLLRSAARSVVEPDSLGYHLPAVAEWYQAGALRWLERPDQAAYYPYAWELLSLLLLLPFGEVVAGTLPNVFAWAVLGLAVCRVARELGARRLSALVAALAVLTVPLVRHQLAAVRVDLALCAFFTAAVASVLALARTRSAADAITLGGALAMVAGTKMPGLVYDATVLVAMVVTGLVALPRRGGRLVLPLSVPAALVASVWYLRNLVRAGNPLGLVPVRVGGVTIFPGSLTAAHVVGTSLMVLFDPLDRTHWAILGGVAGAQLGLPFALLAAAAITVALQRSTWSRRPRVFVALLLAACALLYAMTPFSGDSGRAGRLTPWMGENLRYALPFVALSGAFGAVGLDRVRYPWMLVAGACALAAGALNSWFPIAGLVIAAGAGAVVAWRRLPRRSALTALAAGVVLLVVGTARMRAMHASDRARRHGPTWDALARHVPASRPVGVLYSHRRFLLYGPDLQRRVDDVHAGLLDRDGWIAMLERRGIREVAVGPTERTVLPEMAWLDDATGPFERVLGHDPRRDLVLYRLRLHAGDE